MNFAHVYGRVDIGDGRMAPVTGVSNGCHAESDVVRLPSSLLEYYMGLAAD